MTSFFKYRYLGAFAVFVLAQVLIVMAARSYMGEIFVYKSDTFSRQKRFDRAKEFATVAAQFDPRSGYAQMNIATNDFFLKNFKEAIPVFEKSLVTIPHTSNVIRLLAQSYYSTSEYAKAAALFERYYRMVPKPSTGPETLAYFKAMSLYRVDRHGDAAIAFAEAEQYPDYRNQVLQSRMINAILMNHYNFAGFMYRRLRHLYPDEPINSNELFSNTLALNKIPSAIAFLESVRRRGDADGPILKILALAYVRMGKFDDAINALSSGLSMNPSDPELYLLIGDVAFKEGKVDIARTNYEHHLRLAPDSKFRKEIEAKLKPR